MNEANQSEWQAPPIPEEIRRADEAPRMSEAATLGNIFFSPGETFDDLRRKPRFLLATLIMIILSTAFTFLFINKVGDEEIRRFAEQQIAKSPQADSMSAEQKKTAVGFNVTIFKAVPYLIPVFLIIGLAIGSLVYWLATKAMGGTAGFMQTVAVWVYSSFPPTVVSMLANTLVLFLKSTDELDIAASQTGLIRASPAFFFEPKTAPVLSALVGSLDLFLIWGWILAAIGLRIVGKISSGAAWAIVLIVALIHVAFRVIQAFFS